MHYCSLRYSWRVLLLGFCSFGHDVVTFLVILTISWPSWLRCGQDMVRMFFYNDVLCLLFWGYFPGFYYFFKYSTLYWSLSWSLCHVDQDVTKMVQVSLNISLKISSSKWDWVRLRWDLFSSSIYYYTQKGEFWQIKADFLIFHQHFPPSIPLTV